MSKYYYAQEGYIKTCSSPSTFCAHTHSLFLSSAAREICKNFGRNYHIDTLGEIERCSNKQLCKQPQHFLTRHEVVKFHKETYDFSGPWRALPNPYVSLLETEFADIIEKLGYQVVRNTRKVISPYELDLYLPEIDIAFEFNGNYWHSDEMLLSRSNMTAQEYHKKKFTMCEEQGIILGFVWESNWMQDWVTTVDAACEMIQFVRRTPILHSFSKPLSPMKFNFEKIDRDGMEKTREKITKRHLKQNIKNKKQDIPT